MEPIQQEPLVRVDAQGRIEEFNAAAAELFGLAPENALGRALAEVSCEALAALRASRASAVKELDSFTHAVAHDLRAPVRHVEGFAGLLESEAKDQLQGEALHFLEVIGKAAKKMNAMLEGLIAYSRAGRAELRAAELDMGQIAAEAVAEAQRKAPGRRVEWSIGDLPAAHGDRALVRQVWDILLENALKFTGKADSAHIELGSREGAHFPDEGFEYFVRDDGAGLEMQYAKKLFSLFQRVHNEKEFEGLGVGLAVAQRIVSRHGGAMSIDGKSAGGALVTFTLPRRSPEGTGR